MMKVPCTLAFLFAVQAVGMSQVNSGSAKMPPGAYLRHPAGSGQDVAEQIKKDKLVAERYSRLWHLTSNSVVALARQLHAEKLKSDRLLRVYYVHPGEQLGYKLRRVKKGTPVFALADGSPAMIQACGNPVRSSMANLIPTGLGGRKVRVFRPYEPLDGPAESLDIVEQSLVSVYEPTGQILLNQSPFMSGDAMDGFVPEPGIYKGDRKISIPARNTYGFFQDWFKKEPVLPPDDGPPPVTPFPRGPLGPRTRTPGGGNPPGGPPSGPNPPSSINITAVPEPGPLWIGAASLVAFAGWRKRLR